MKSWKFKENFFTAWLSKQGFWKAVRKSRGLRGERVEDIAWGPFSIELKTRKAIPKYLLSWMTQAETNCDGRLPIVLIHQDNMQAGSQLVVLTLDNFVRMLTELLRTAKETIAFSGQSWQGITIEREEEDVIDDTVRCTGDGEGGGEE